MKWQDLLKTVPLDWLVDIGGPGTHYLVLRDLVELPENDLELQKVKEIAHQTGPISEVLANMDPAGYWAAPGPGYNPKYRSTVWAIILLAQLGASIDQDERLGRACSYVLEHSLSPAGQFTMTGAPSGTVDCLQGNLCWALWEIGCRDPRLQPAFEWMARTVTGEGLASNTDRQAPARFYAGKCGPRFACGANDTLPCAWGAVKVLLAFSQLPGEWITPLTQRAIHEGLDFLFNVDPATAAYPTGYTDKPSRNWWKFGFPVFYVTDLLQLVEAAARLGWGQDPRLANAISTILEKQDEQGRWDLEYNYAGKTWLDFGAMKQPNPWVTLRALRTLKFVSAGSN
jgi:hypothetical protein